MSAEPNPINLTQQVDQHLGRVLENSHTLHSHLHMLHIMREKVRARSYQPYDQREITTELQRLNYQVQKLYSSMEALVHLLND
jgi:hypothetical protein